MADVGYSYRVGGVARGARSIPETPPAAAPLVLPAYPERVRFAYSYDAAGTRFTDPAGTAAASNGQRVRAIRDWRPGGALAVNRTGSSNSPLLDPTGLLFGQSAVASWLDTDVLQSSPFTILLNCGQSPGANALLACNAGAETTTFLSADNSVIYAYQNGNGSTAATGAGVRIRGAVFNGASSKIFSGGTITTVSGATAAAWLARIGAASGGFVFTGPILDVVGWDGALSDAELAVAAADMATWRARTPQAVPSGTEVELVIALHLEGATASPGGSGYTALQTVMSAYPWLRLTIGLSPSTYSQAGAVASQVDATFTEVAALGTGPHEYAQHDHAHDHYVSAAGVAVRTSPSFNGGVTALNGYDMLLTAYTQVELNQIVVYGRNLLVSRGFPAPTTYIAGGWLLDSTHRESIRAAGFLRDLSRLPEVYAYTNAVAPYLSGLLAVEYAGARNGDQPFVEVLTAGNLIRFTAQAGASDYDSGNTIQIETAKRVLQAKLADPTNRKRLVLSAHYDSGSLANLKAALDAIVPWAASVGLTLAPRTAAQAS